MANAPGPKESKVVLEPTLNTLAVESGLFFDYYPIKLGAKVGDFVEILRMPTIISEGYVTYARKLYRLNIRDFFRRRVNVTQPSYSPTPTFTSPNANSTNSPSDSIGSVVEAGAGNVQSGTSETAELQLIEHVNLAWEEQINTLLHSVDQEEEWFPAYNSQSRRGDAGSPV